MTESGPEQPVQPAARTGHTATLTALPLEPQRRRIVDAALELAGQDSWEALRLADVARHLDCSLDDLRRHFREKEEIVDAWLDRADAAMLQAAPADSAEDPLERFENAVLVWLAVLRPHHGVTRQMIAGKLEPGHLHVQFPAVLRISRTVQWLREASGRRHALPARALDETLLTGVFVATFSRWLLDRRGGDLEQARRTLSGLLGGLRRISRLPGLGRLARDDPAT